MKLNFQTSQIKRFFQNASSIKNNGIIPITGYLLVDHDTITKTNLNSFCQMSITDVGGRLLLDERTLSAFIKGTNKDTFTAEVKNGRVTLSDGVNKPYFALEDDSSFPKFPESEKENETKLEEKTLKAIAIASKNVIMNSRINNPFEFVHLKDGYVMASDTDRFYFCKIGDTLPNITIDYDTASVISQFGGATYYTKGNYNFFQIGGTLYAFIKAEVKTPDFMRVIESVTKGEYMEFSSSELLNFLDLATSLSPSPTLVVSIKGNLLSFSDDDYNVGNEREIDVKGDFKPELDFLPKVFTPFFKSINQERIRVSPIEGRPQGLTVWSENESDWCGIVSGVIKQ